MTKTYYLQFELFMSKIGSWDGKWSGAGKQYIIIQAVDSNIFNRIITDTSISGNKLIFNPRKYSYDFKDGWEVTIVVSATTSKSLKLNKLYRKNGFAGYEWMVFSIIKHNEILN